MIIRIENSPHSCKARAGQTILLALARTGVVLSAPCGGRNRCGKCKVRLVSGQVSGEIPDEKSMIRACVAVPASDIVIDCIENYSVISSELDLESPGKEQLPGIVIPSPVRAGVALDIGTTTVSARLIDLDTNKILETISEFNNQRSFGADIMSRIDGAMNGKTNELFKLINTQTERILVAFIEKWNLKRIEKLIVSGNTCMLHLFLNTDPSGMGTVPFTPVFLNEKETTGRQLGLSTESVMLLPSIAAFIGADITGGLAALDILNGTQPSLYIDIGTNGEMALFNKGNIFCCSAATGPAFEGAEISCGMSAISGAISAVELVNKTDIEITTIGNAPARGICGSGLIDAVSIMLKQGIIDETGYMENHPDGYTIAPGVTIINRDIRQFQLAKSAVYSGVKVLCKKASLEFVDIKSVHIAGGFGFFINRKNSIDVGLLPKEFIDRISIHGNMSLRGAEELLASKSFIEKCREIISRCSVIDLSADPDFMDEFAGNMGFSIQEGTHSITANPPPAFD